jgi:hypothetical protein
MSNPTGKGGFQERKHQINRKGRPRSFDALRELAQQIAHEEATTKDGDTLTASGHIVSVAEAIMRGWASSKNPQLQRAFIEVAFGKVPDKVEMTGKDGGPIENKNIIEVTAIDYRDAITPLAPRPVADSDPSGESQDPGNGPEMG